MQAALDKGAVSAAIECTDTIYKFDANGRLELPLLERASLKAMQTPQVFDFDLLYRAHHDLQITASDDAGLVAMLGPVWLVKGEIGNLKITSIEDLRTAERRLSGDCANT